MRCPGHAYFSDRVRQPGLLGPAVLEAVDVMLGVGDRGVRIEPGEADFEGGKGITVDDQRAPIGAPDAGMPQSPTGLEGFDSVTFVKACHVAFPRLSGEDTTNPAAAM